MTTHLPANFISEINRLLGEQSSRFLDEILTQPAISGVRINSLKSNPEKIRQLLSTDCKPLPWVEDGCQLPQGLKLGKHPFHAAGLFYLQEPSAMAPAGVLAPQPGELILDLCAAPGGKTTQILSLMKNQGVLVANDSNPSRVQSLVRNVDRWGANNAVITCEVPEKLSTRFGPIFDRILVDAPCSGEGTFRGDPAEIKKWSTSFTRRCASIQDELLWFAAKMVRPGGILVYSTCTFNQLENEGSVTRFLQKNPNFVLDPIPHQPGFSSGIPHSESDPDAINRTVRIWPHLAPGEGHFIARLRNIEENARKPTSQKKSPGIASDHQRVYEKFFLNSLKRTRRTEVFSPGVSALAVFGNRLYWIPREAPSLEGLRVHHWGWWLGTIQSNRFIPSSALAFGLAREDSQMVIEFQLDDPDLISYLRGSPIPYPREGVTDKGWVLVTVEGFPLGWGKNVQGRLKSYFPNWLRQSY